MALVLASGERLLIAGRSGDMGSMAREHVRREVLAYQLLADSGPPVPALISSDQDGTSAGGPANLLTWLPGQSRLN